eukprot:g46088.t1
MVIVPHNMMESALNLKVEHCLHKNYAVVTLTDTVMGRSTCCWQIGKDEAKGLKKKCCQGTVSGLALVQVTTMERLDWVKDVSEQVQDIQKGESKQPVVVVNIGTNDSHNAEEEEFLECIQDGFPDKYVEEQTGEQAILDWMLVNEKGIIVSLAMRDLLGNIDHNMIEFFYQDG